MLIAGSIIPLFGHGLGGFAAGYLRGSDGSESTIAGGIAGGLFVLPTALGLGLIAVLGVFGTILEGDARTAALTVLIGVLTVVVFLVVVAIGAVGGYVGAEVTDRPAP